MQIYAHAHRVVRDGEIPILHCFLISSSFYNNPIWPLEDECEVYFKNISVPGLKKKKKRKLVVEFN